MTPRQQIASVGYSYMAKDVISVPAGIITMWSGSIADIPEGWVLCDGTNGTPDLRDRFVVGATQDGSGVAKTSVKGSLMVSGGEHEHALSIAEMPSHTHSFGPSLVYHAPGSGGEAEAAGDGGHSPKVILGSTGGNGAHENCPPFYALAYIMKL